MVMEIVKHKMIVCAKVDGLDQSVLNHHFVLIFQQQMIQYVLVMANVSIQTIVSVIIYTQT